MTATDIVPLYLHPHGASNVPIGLYEGAVVVRHDNGESSGSGRVSLRWLPTTGLRLEAELSPGIPDRGGRMTVTFSGSTTEVLVSSLQHRFGADGHSIKIGASIRSVEIGTPSAVASIGFQVVNFPDVLTPGKAAEPAFGYPPSVVDLRSVGWRVRLTGMENSTEVFKNLAATGGYAFTHLGRLEREDGAAFLVADAREILNTLPSLLSYARGSSCGIPLCWAVDAAGAVVWEQWASATVDAWKTSYTWFDEHHGRILSEIFPAFVEAYNDRDSRDALQLALHWFQKSNTRAGGMEGAIILGLTSLDLLGAMVVVDRASIMGASKYDNLKAADKLARLLEVMKVAVAIPAKYENLTKFARSQGWEDAPTTLTEIRHGYVHPNHKRRAVVLSAPNLATFEAWQLSLWYQELALLFLLNHMGQYRNRVAAQWVGEVETVPWS